MVDENGKSLEELADEMFDSMGYEEGDELTFDPNAYRKSEEITDADIVDDDSGGDESKTDPTEKKTEPEKLYAGKFKTVEEMEAAFLESQKQPEPEKKPEQQNKIIDLSREELTTLHETDEQDGNNYTVQYLNAKMKERDLTDFELEKLRELDTDGKDLYGQYISVKTKRETLAELEPVIKPIQAEQSEKAQKAWSEREKAINDSNIEEFGKDLDGLKKQISDKSFTEKILSESPNGQMIVALFESGNQALAYKNLLREVREFNRREAEKTVQEKKKKSFPADPGSKSNSVKKSDKALTIEEAFDLSAQELNFD